MTDLELNPIRTEADYCLALARASRVFDADEELDPQTPEGAWFDALLTLIEGWERRHHPVDPPDAVDAIKFRMAQQGLTVVDLQPYIGQRNRVYEVLARKRPLTLTMIRRLHAGLGISAEALIGGQTESGRAIQHVN